MRIEEHHVKTQVTIDFRVNETRIVLGGIRAVNTGVMHIMGAIPDHLKKMPWFRRNMRHHNILMALDQFNCIFWGDCFFVDWSHKNLSYSRPE
jgi:hypothetical protein